MIRIRVSSLLLLAAVAVGCSKDTDGELSAPPALAGLRYVNLVPDTGAVNFRVVDIVAWAPNTINASLRTAGQPYGIVSTTLPMHTPVLAGPRTISVFPSSTNPAIASTILLDTTLTFTQGVNYTVYLYGYMRTGGSPAVRAVVVDDTPPTLAAGQIGIRAINLAPTVAPTIGTTNVDVYLDANALGTVPSGLPNFTALAPGQIGAFGARAAGALRAAVTESPGVTQLLNATFPAGTAGTSTTQPVPGTTVAGTAITVIIAPPSVAGSPATAFATPGLIFIVDGLPPRTAP